MEDSRAEDERFWGISNWTAYVSEKFIRNLILLCVFFFLVKFVWWRYVVQCALLVVGAFKREIRTINMAFINNMISFSTF